MTTRFEAPSHEDLIAEQTVVQASKFQGRMLTEYNYYLFPGQEYRQPQSSAVADMVRPLCEGEEYVSLAGVLNGLHASAGGERPIHWVEMGGGRGLPMREAATSPQLKDKIHMTQVDLFDYGLE